jgi:hypothetical protein
MSHIITDINPIYKVNNLVDGQIDTIYVFYGKNKNEYKNKIELFKKIFTENEIKQINDNNINVVFSEQQIHYDDTISSIKIKILNELKKKVSIEEIYLFSQKIETLNAVSVYQSLTQNKKIELTNVRLHQFISNIVSEENGATFNKPPIKDVYTFDDILEMKINDKKYIINKVLGQKFFLIENEYPFVCNPFLVDGYDNLFEKNVRKSLSTLNSHLLLNNGEILNNNILILIIVPDGARAFQTCTDN